MLNLWKPLALSAMLTGASLLPASGQSVEQIFQSAANAKGKSCDAVTQMKPLGRTSDGKALIAVACSGGERYAFTIEDDDSVTYISTCSTLEAVANISCF